MQVGNKHAGLWCSCVIREEELSRSCEEVENSGGHPKHKVSEFGHMFQRDGGAEC